MKPSNSWDGSRSNRWPRSGCAINARISQPVPFSSIRSLVWLDPQGTTITKSTGRSTAELTFAVAESFPQEERETTVKTKAEGEKKEKAEGEKRVIYQDKVGSIRQKVENETNLTVTWKSAVLDAYGSE